MEPNETMVNDENLSEGLDEEFLNLVGSETEESEEQGVSIESFLNEEAEAQPDGNDQQNEDTQSEQGKRGTGEPGYVKKRVNEAVEKALANARETMRAEIRAEVQADFDKKIAPIIAKMREDEAQELVRSRKVADIETARELVNLRHGQAPSVPESKPAEEQQQPRNAQGQFVAKDDPVIQARVDILSHQADTIKAKTGIDVMAEFEQNAEIKKKVLSGEMDFYEVAELLKAKPQKKRPPAPMRSPNGVGGQISGPIMDLTDEQFARLEKRVREQG